MTNATKTLSAILFIFVALTVGVKLASHPSASKAFRGTIVNVDTARVNKMIINSPTKNKKITLQKKSHGWKVSGGGSKTLYPADHRRVSRALGMLTHLDVKAIATRNPKNYTRYKADSTGTKVLLMNGNKQLAGLIIGAPQFVSRRQFNNYVRPIGNKTVYAVNGFLRPAFSTSVNQWRNKKVWKLNRSKISAIDFKFPADSSYTIKKVDGGKWISNRDTLK
ncbi:MAG TPA: DUF4340 domain-containing protein, partial [Balneolaceae bacterium]|nr:DUF4340 domain-containing protein [Balneolaceae bacterium]